MRQNRLFIKLLLFFSPAFLNLIGCTPTVNLPDLSADKIKNYKTVKVYANRSRANNTGVYVEKGDFYSFIVTGRVSTSRWNRAQVGYDGVKPERKLGVMIDKKFQVVPPINATIDAQAKGEISLVVEDAGFMAEYGYAKYNSKAYQDNTGSFEATIIVWKTKNLDHIVDIFKQLKMLNREEEVAEKVFVQAQSLRTSLAEVKIASDENKNQIREKSAETLNESDKTENLDITPPGLAVSVPEAQQTELPQEITGDSFSVTESKDLYASALPMREISYILNRINSERLIFIADSCYSGASGGRTVSIEGIRANISDSYINRIASGKGRVIMTASAANEVSVEDDALQHGIFTYYLIEGLRGSADYDSDGLVTVDEAYRYVSEEVPKATAQEQHPVKKGSVEGQLVLGIVK